MSNVLKLREFTEGTEHELSSEAQALIDYTVRTPKRQRFTRESIAEQFNETFQLIGGVPRLALWADQNPSQFFNLYSKLLPAAVKAELNITHSPIETLSVEQIRELPTEQFKLLLLARSAELATDATIVEPHTQSE